MARHNGSLIGALNRPTSANFSGITTINGKRQQAMKNQAGRIGVFNFAERLFFNKGLVSLPEMRQLKQESNWPTVQSSVQYLIVAGGGGSAYGGGGAGGLLEGSASVNIHETLTIEVGSGGTGYNVTSQPNNNGENGENSSIAELSLTAIGGGGGSYGGAGSAGGSGGGGGYAFSVVSGGSETSGQGNAGGSGGVGVNDARTGGGGGAGSAGGNPSASVMGSGGDGVESSITGSAVYYAGGGGGTARGGSGDTNGSIGLGGGSGNHGGGGHVQGSGGAGVIILRYLTSEFRNITTGSPSTSTDGDYTIITFTGDGSLTI